MVGGIIILQELRKFAVYDNFGIYQELKYFFYAVCVNLIVVIISTIIYVASKINFREIWLFASITQFIYCMCLEYILVPSVIQYQNKVRKVNKETNNEIDDYMPDISNMQHWSQAVASELGYELFMNHLQSEFSIENALFITEYVQIKDVLKNDDTFGPIMTTLLQEQAKSRLYSFDVNLSPIVPISKIAQKLCDDNDIVTAFKSLYKKYIDSQNAPFMINIASKNREKLMISLDCKYYQNQIIQQQRQQKNGKRISITIRSKFENLNSMNSNNYISNKETLIDIEYFKQNESKEWLLTRLILEMDAAAREISQLMNGSFLRFKRNQM